MKLSDRKKLERTLRGQSDYIVDRACTDFGIEQKTIEQERADALAAIPEDNKKKEAETKINKEFDQKQQEVRKNFHEALAASIDNLVNDAKKNVVERMETSKIERQKDSMEDKVRDHLRGFSRTIPSFLMAYGDDSTSLGTIDKVVPPNIFKEVTSITLDEFCLLRDGGTYKDKETGEEKRYVGHLFDAVVFDDSVKEFLNLKKKLADYFDETQKEDIFDYVPPQRTNQIYTPKATVQKMVDMLEQENPGCFDKPDKTFIDLYMKSGLYITEIVKRLYQSKKMKKLFPDNKERLNHIFAEQVYGLAPTEIIYKIATNYILGFSSEIEIRKNNFRQCDALEYVKNGTLAQTLAKLF